MKVGVERLSWKPVMHHGLLATKHSRGRVVNMLKPNRSRATLTMRLSRGKLFKMLPCVLSPKVRNPASAIVMQASIEANVE